MAMKLTDAQKAVDSAIRSYNRQLEKAYNELGYDHTITRNLVSTARSIFGKDAIKAMDTKYIDRKNIDYSTGEYHETIQIKRSKSILDKAISENLIDKLNKATRFTNKTSDRSLDKYNGTYNRLYNVTLARNTAIEQLRMFHQAHLPQSILDNMKGKSVAQKNDILQAYLKRVTTTDNIDMQIFYNDLASEVFAGYHQARDEIDNSYYDYDEAFLKMQEFAQNYNANNYDLNLLYEARRARDNWIYSQQYRDELEQIQGTSFNKFNDLNIF